MNSPLKALIIFIVIVVTLVTAILVVKKKSGPNAIFLQSPKSVLIKAAKKRIITPNQARNFLNDLDMPTRPYSDMWGANKYGKYEADSDNFILESRDVNRYKNNLSYSVLGTKFAAKAVELNLNVNDMSFKKNAVGELIKYSDVLIYKVTGKHLTPEIKKAMQTQTSGEWLVNGYKIKLTAYIAPDEKVIKGEEPTSDHGAFSLMFLIEL